MLHVAGQLDLDGNEVPPPPPPPPPNPAWVTVSFEMDADLAAGECWPDGEPEHWTVRILAEEIRRTTPSLGQFLSEWGIDLYGAVITLRDDQGNWTDVTLR